MSDRLQRTLEALEEVLAAREIPVVVGLQPGLKESVVRQRLAQLGLDPPQEVITLFGWHDGYAARDNEAWNGWIGPNIRPLSLDEACRAFSENLEEFELEAAEMGGTEGTQWFPFLDGAGWTSYLVDCRPDGPFRGSVVAYHITNMTEPERRPSSLAEVFEECLILIESGAWVWEPATGWTDYRNESQLEAPGFF